MKDNFLAFAKPFWLLFTLSGLPFNTAFCQQQYQFENYTTANGLSDNRVTCFFKDREGYMWIGTENGLNRFDGHSFVIYNAGLKTHKLSNPFINDIEQDASGRLWVATENGLNIVNLKNDSTTIFVSENDDYRQKPEVVPSNLIWDTYISKDGKIWLAADVRDLCYYDTAQHKFYYLPWKKYIAEKFPNREKSYNSIRKIYYKSDNELWLGTSVGLFSYNISAQTFSHYPSYQADVFISLQQADNKIYYIQEPGVDIQELKESGQYSKINIGKESVTRHNTSDSNANELLWFPAGKRLVGINTVTGVPNFISHITDNNYSLPPGSIRNVYKDDHGIIWVASDNGIGKFNPSMIFFPFVTVDPALELMEPEHDLYRVKHNVHTAFYSQQDNKYYISSSRFNCLYIIDKQTGHREKISEALGIPLKNCSVIREDSKGRLWILSGVNAFTYDRKTKKFSLSGFTSKSNNLLFTDMEEDDRGNIWFACMNDGLYRYDTSTKIIWTPAAADQFKSTLPTSLFFDKVRKKMWVGTFEYGLYEYDYLTGTFVNYNQSNSSNIYVHSALITDIIPDRYNNIWVSTYANGISRLKFADRTPTSQKVISPADGLPENNIFSLAADNEGNIWATTFKGISKLSPDGNLLKNYDQHTGLPYVDFYGPFTLTNNGELITGVSNGFIIFKPDNLVYHPAPFSTVITSFNVKTKEQLKALDPSATASLAYYSNEVQFNFAAFNYQFSPQTKYSFLLEGQDKSRSVTSQHSITYNNLAPGNYTFKVKAIDFAGNPSENEAMVSFRILPPWWQTWWFRFLVASTIVAGIAFIFRTRIKNIRQQAAVRQQIAELKAQALRAQMNPHFIFNSLNAIQELIVTENYSASYEYLAKFSKLLRLVLDITEKNFIPLSLEIEMCSLYLELESLRFKHSFHYIIDADNIDTDVTLFPTLLIQPFIENAIWHGLMHKEGEKKVTIHFTEKEDSITCTIRDNGIGRQRAAVIKASKIGSGYFTSKGILIARQRVESLVASSAGKGSIAIIDCKDEHGNAEGTEVKINISLSKQ